MPSVTAARRYVGEVNNKTAPLLSQIQIGNPLYPPTVVTIYHIDQRSVGLHVGEDLCDAAVKRVGEIEVIVDGISIW